MINLIKMEMVKRNYSLVEINILFILLLENRFFLYNSLALKSFNFFDPMSDEN